MKRQLQREELGKLYKEFSRQKYNKYKHQYPRMKESELVTKIIKEWEASTKQEKLRLYQVYTDNKELPQDQSESSNKKESPGSSKEKRKNQTSLSKNFSNFSVAKTPNKKATAIRVFNRSSSSKKAQNQVEQWDFEKEGGEKKFLVSEQDSNQDGKKVSKKGKKIVKQVKAPRREYLKFFKFYYEKLSKQHSKWSASQITTIIKLLWNKKLSQQKRQKIIKSTRPKQFKRQSGRMTYRKNFNYDSMESTEGWKQLPRESKSYWKYKGVGLSNQSKGIEPNITFKSTRRGGRKGSQDTESNAQKFSYLLKQMN